MKARKRCSYRFFPFLSFSFLRAVVGALSFPYLEALSDIKREEKPYRVSIPVRGVHKASTLTSRVIRWSSAVRVSQPSRPYDKKPPGLLRLSRRKSCTRGRGVHATRLHLKTGGGEKTTKKYLDTGKTPCFIPYKSNTITDIKEKNLLT